MRPPFVLRLRPPFFANGHLLPSSNESVQEKAKSTPISNGVLSTMLIPKTFHTAFPSFLLVGMLTGAPVRPEIKDEKAKAKLEFGPVNSNFLLQRSLMRELKCNADQRDAIADALEVLDRKTNKAIWAMEPELDQTKPEDAQRYKIEVQKIRVQAEEQARKVAVKELDYDQLVRLGQIALQARGPRAFQFPKVVRSLKLTKNQQAAIARAVTDYYKDMDGEAEEVPEGGGGPPPAGTVYEYIEEDPADVMKRQAAAVKKIVDKLDKSQQTACKRLVGAPLKYPVFWLENDPG
jgi:hypothetical protein